MRRINRFATAALLCSPLALLTACASPEGTWRVRDGLEDSPFNFGAVAFVGDGTYAAEARYRDETRVAIGGWRTEGDRLYLTEVDRSYRYEVEGDEMIMVDLDTNIVVTLDRYRAQ